MYADKDRLPLSLAPALMVIAAMLTSCEKGPNAGDAASDLGESADKAPVQVSRTTLSPTQPQDVEFVAPETHTFEGDLESFARFAWKDFIALNWPAQMVERGQPDAQKAFGAKTERVVWQTWMSIDDIFPPDALEHAPKEWRKSSPAEEVIRKTKLTEVNQAGFATKLDDPTDEFNRPLIAAEMDHT